MHRILHALAIERYVTLDAAGTAEEWLLRPLRRRQASRALVSAGELTAKTDLAHVARVARLAALGRAQALPLDDEPAVAAAYAALPAPADRKLPVQTLALLGAVVALALFALTAKLALRPFAADRSGLGAAFSQRFGAHVADVANGKRPSADEGMDRVFPGRTLPEPVRAPMAALFAAQIEAARDPKRMPDVYARTRDVNQALGLTREPYYLDARFYQRAPLLYAFYKEREDDAEAAGFARERVVYLWRLDRLNISKAALGYTHRESDAALVLYDQIEEELIVRVLPGLAEGEKVDLVDDDSRDSNKAWQDDIEQRSARMVRESFAGAADRERLVELGTLLAKRRAIVRRWQVELASQHATLAVPRRLIPEADYLGELHLRVPTESRREWESIHDRLTSRAMLATFEALRDRFAEDVARHEVQHRFDGQRTADCEVDRPCESLVIPEAVRRRVGPEPGVKAALGGLPARVRSETSAYLAEMARPHGMPKMTLLGLLPTVLDRRAWGDVYCNTTLVLLDVLAEELHLGGGEDTPLVVRGAVQRGAVSSLVVLLFAKSDAELADAASKAWARLFGAPLPAVTLTKKSQEPRWRH